MKFLEVRQRSSGLARKSDGCLRIEMRKFVRKRSQNMIKLQIQMYDLSVCISID